MKTTRTKRSGLGIVIWPMVGLVVLIFSVAAFVDPRVDPEGVRPAPRPPTFHTEEEIERAARMAERMQVSRLTDEPSHGGAPGDEQHPQNPAFIEELEQYSQDLDRMLGRGAP